MAHNINDVEAKGGEYGSEEINMTKTHTTTGINEIDLSGGHQLERGLKSRHIQ
jgi:amino acid transporter